ncbi:MAG: type II secretion system minor pseudopilin GspI [Wenzhouxiangellaceae bacterium]
MKDRGFTLIEVLVALAVVALALTALGMSAMRAVETRFEIEQRSLALWLAENRLAEARLDRALQPGTVRGQEAMGDRQWQWQRSVQPAPGGLLWRIDVAVLDEQGAPVLTHTGFQVR